ncbi:MAG: hypothetical protein RLY65_1325 [Pseudomonadota bacterium]
MESLLIQILNGLASASTLLPNGWYGFGLACVVLSFATGGADVVHFDAGMSCGQDGPRIAEGFRCSPWLCD